MIPTNLNNNRNDDLTASSDVETVELGQHTHQVDDDDDDDNNCDNKQSNHTVTTKPKSLSKLPRHFKNNIHQNTQPSSQRNSWDIESTINNKKGETSSTHSVTEVNDGHTRSTAQKKWRYSTRGKKRFFSSLRTKLGRKMRRGSHGSCSGSFNDNDKVLSEDITDFHSIEQSKTFVRKRLKFFATMLFYFALGATALVLVDTQMTIKLDIEKETLQAARVNETTTKIIGHEYKAIKERIFQYRVIGLTAKSCISVISIAMCIALYFYYRNLFYLKTIRFFYPKNMSFFRATPLVKMLMIECLICLFHVPPFLDYVIEIPNQVQVLVFLRLYLLGRYLKEKHELMNSQATRFLASVTKTELTSMFLFKTFFMQYPFQMILLAYVILLFIGGYGVWLIEERYTYLDTVWMLIITMTTVGFGDLTPETMFGRFAVGITAIVGIFLMALFISLVNEALMLSRREKRILSYVDNQDSTRRRKVCALNAIGMWFKYHIHLKRYFGMKETEVLIGRGIRAQAKKDIVSIVKAKLLETRMYRSINEWRKIKNDRGGGGFFAQEFMIEDMKNMMVDFTHRMNEFDEKMDTISADVKTMKNLSTKMKRASTDKERMNNVNSSPYDIDDNNEKINERGDIHNYSNELSIRGTLHFNGDSDNSYPSPSNNRSSTGKGIRELLPDVNSRSKSIRKSELQMAFKLLKNQAKIMNNALDDIYYKTRQDICDMENIINSLLICSDAEENTVDYVPSRDWSLENPNA